MGDLFFLNPLTLRALRLCVITEIIKSLLGFLFKVWQ